MNSQPQPTTDNPVREIGLLAGVLAFSLGTLLYVSQQALTVPAPAPTITLEWDNPPEVPGTFTTEVWSTANFTTWTLKTNIAGTNRVKLPATNKAEFFKIRNRGTNGLFSDWSRKTTL